METLGTWERKERRNFTMVGLVWLAEHGTEEGQRFCGFWRGLYGIIEVGKELQDH